MNVNDEVVMRELTRMSLEKAFQVCSEKAAQMAEECPEGVTKMKRGRTGSAGARSALSEKAPERGAGGETQDEIIIRVVNEKKGAEMTLEDIIFEISKDEVFGAYLKKEPRGLSRKIGGVAKRGLIKKTDDGKYVAA